MIPGYPGLRRKEFQYADVLEKVRKAVLDEELPDVPFGKPAKIGVLDDGSRERLTDRARQHKCRILWHVAKRWPTDKWRVSYHPIPGAWKGYEIWVEFVGIAPSQKAARAWATIERKSQSRGGARG